ncbi:hypothetical protein BDP27DRAFT_1370860 [Rhodocollybia butyracea]|uniref:Uncharacterized protein n=1 Tax=Rhodocollybia butyracea TaxID=206335 RepID=A0A9P5PB53_9AGAR|nr:hypothetical protein BDP27DRAFT_1370860 [Rhodocollybia butyracea]
MEVVLAMKMNIRLAKKHNIDKNTFEGTKKCASERTARGAELWAVPAQSSLTSGTSDVWEHAHIIFVASLIVKDAAVVRKKKTPKKPSIIILGSSIIVGIKGKTYSCRSVERGVLRKPSKKQKVKRDKGYTHGDERRPGFARHPVPRCVDGEEPGIGLTGSTKPRLSEVELDKRKEQAASRSGSAAVEYPEPYWVGLLGRSRSDAPQAAVGVVYRASANNVSGPVLPVLLQNSKGLQNLMMQSI